MSHTHNVNVGGSTGGRSAVHAHAISGSTQNTGSGATATTAPKCLQCYVVAE
jgi:hypothetical protein